jgi:hypothetical protein
MNTETKNYILPPIKKIYFYIVQKKDDLIALLVFAVLSLLANFQSSLVTEPDNLYHIAVANIYKTRGIFFTNFSWDTFSVFAKYPSDLWYGFHLLLIPFLSGNNYALALHAAGALMTFSLAACCYFIFRQLKVSWPIFWVLFIFLSTPQELFRMIDPRPQIAISALAALFFYFLAWRRNRKAMFFISILFSFIDASMFWLPFCFFFLDWLGQNLPRIARQGWKSLTFGLRFYLADFGCILAGAGLGLFLRPNPLAGLHLFYYQIIYLFWQKFRGVPLSWGTEIYPLRGGEIFFFLGLIIIFFVFFVFWILSDRPNGISSDQSRFLNSGFTVSFFFLVLSFVSASRAFDFFVPTSVFVIALSYQLYRDSLPMEKQNFRYALFVLFEIMFIVSLCMGFSEQSLGVNDYAGEANFLQKNSGPGDIVANLSFDDYPGLFLLDKQNRYLNHADPIFQYAYNPTVDKKFLCAMENVTGKKGWNSDITKYCQDEAVVSDKLLQTVRDDFNARYVFVGIHDIGSAALRQYFSVATGSKMVYSDTHGAIFELKPAQ